MHHGNPQTAADGQHIVLGGLDDEHLFHLGELFRHLGGEVVGLGPVLFEVVELPPVLVGSPLADAWAESREPTGRAGRRRKRSSRRGRCPAAHDLEVLGQLASLGLRIGEGVGEADAVDWDPAGCR